MTKIVAVNESTVVSNAQVQECIAALEIQANRDFAPVWGTEQVSISFLPKKSPVPKGAWELVFADDSNQADALGYHELSEVGGPIGFCFCKSDLDDGESWTVTASHECMEMLADPFINRTCEASLADGSGVFFMQESCDACEDDSFGYEIKIASGQEIKVSDFVHPSWFLPNAEPPFDFGKHIGKPLQVLKNGYIAYCKIGSASWQQETGELVDKTSEKVMPTPYHRRYRRIVVGRHNWKLSEPRT